MRPGDDHLSQIAGRRLFGRFGGFTCARGRGGGRCHVAGGRGGGEAVFECLREDYIPVLLRVKIGSREILLDMNWRKGGGLGGRKVGRTESVHLKRPMNILVSSVVMRRVLFRRECR